MKSYAKPITKQLVIAALILTSVTILSLGIRQVRFSLHRARRIESPVVAETEPDHLLAELDTVVTEPEQKYVDEPEPDDEVPLEDYSETNPSKSDYTKAKGSKSLEKMSMGENENLYIKEGELWYVGKGPDGKSFKMQLHIDETTGEMAVVDRVYSGKSGGPQPIPMGDGYNMYITDEGQSWYVGGGSKARVEVDDTTGEIVILDQYGDDGDK